MKTLLSSISVLLILAVVVTFSWQCSETPISPQNGGTSTSIDAAPRIVIIGKEAGYPVSGARITLVRFETGILVAEGYTNDNGIVEFSYLGDEYYRIGINNSHGYGCSDQYIPINNINNPAEVSIGTVCGD